MPQIDSQNNNKMKQKITLEPVIFLFAFGYSVFNKQLQTNLLLWKVCHVELGHVESICDNLTAHNEIQNKVQIRVNNFEIVGEWLSQWPSILYSFFAGSLSDSYGRKPCLILPILGATIGKIKLFHS